MRLRFGCLHRLTGKIGAAVGIGSLLGIALVAVPAAAEVPRSAAAPELATPEAFERAAGNAAQRRIRTGATRGVPLQREPTVLLDRVTALLAGDTFPEGTGLLLYSRNGDRLQSWLVDAAGIRAATEQQAPLESVAASIARFRATISVDGINRARAARRTGESAPAITPDTPPGEIGSDTLTGLLLPPPVADHLGAIRHLVVIPVDSIALAPFALLEPGGAPLIETTSISIAPSLEAATAGLVPWDYAEASAAPLIVGNPALADDSRWDIPALPGAEDEAVNVADMLGTSMLSGEDASLDAVAGEADEASLLYFATHGSASAEDPLDGGYLMLAAPSLEEGWWTARAIQHRRLAARLAVLSACQTGMGAAIDGGVIGLARAFQLAGVPRVVMSLWSVDDEATRFMMIRFVEALENHVPAEALRLAMLDTREYFPEPGAWASFTLFGTPR